ncbi:hypothetical protein [uncultured Algoriphagus sp.]|uniref:hypothetical protein n=1 Tax=uncultured Algoriphagus sp. TaxID=417365 RepID=UPI0030ED1770
MTREWIAKKQTAKEIKTADWVINLGRKSGNKGGYLTFEGTPEDMMKEEGNYTAKYLREAFV